MIPADSPLRNPPESMPPEQRVAFDGLRYAADMVALPADRLHSDLLEVPSASEKPVSLDPTAFARCFADVWSLADKHVAVELAIDSSAPLEAHSRSGGAPQRRSRRDRPAARRTPAHPGFRPYSA